MSLDRFCRKAVITGSADTDVDTLAHQMRDEHVGAVIIVDERQHPVGIVTDRDIVCRVVANGHAPQFTPASDIMSDQVETIEATEPLDVALFKMRESGLRRLPIVDHTGKLCGLVSLDDLIVLLASELSHTSHTIRENAGP